MQAETAVTAVIILSFVLFFFFLSFVLAAMEREKQNVIASNPMNLQMEKAAELISYTYRKQIRMR